MSERVDDGILSGVLADALDAAMPTRPDRGSLHFSPTRELREADLLTLQTKGPKAVKAPSVLRLKAVHHAIAKGISDGKKDQEIALITGVSPARISVLRSSPAFAELVAYYTSQKAEIYRSMHEKIALLGELTIEELIARLEEKGDAVSIGELREIAKLALDRSGFGPTSRVSHEHTLSTEALDAIKQAAASASRGRVLDLKAMPASLAPGESGAELLPLAESPASGNAGEGPDLPEEVRLVAAE